MKSINQFAFDAVEQRLKGKMKDNGLRAKRTKGAQAVVPKRE